MNEASVFKNAALGFEAGSGRSGPDVPGSYIRAERQFMVLRRHSIKLFAVIVSVLSRAAWLDIGGLGAKGMDP